MQEGRDDQHLLAVPHRKGRDRLVELGRELERRRVALGASGGHRAFHSADARDVLEELPRRQGIEE